MIFTDDTEETLRAAVWLVNSAEDPDTLTSLDDETTFIGRFRYTGRLDRDDAELAGLRSIRPQLRRMLLAPRDDMAAAVNEALDGVSLRPRLTRHGTVDWHLHAISDDHPLPERVIVETAMALIDVIRAEEGSRISVCADDTCEALALDLSRNRSKELPCHISRAA